MPGEPLYQRLLGSAWNDLAPPIRELHSVVRVSQFAGRGAVTRGRSPLSRLLGWAIGFPEAGADQEVAVTLSVEGDSERWLRCIGGRQFSSVQWAGTGRAAGLLGERFGLVSIYMALVVEDGNLRYVLRRWTLLGIPLPLWLGPRSHAYESVESRKFHFDVGVRHPLTGLVVTYSGHLAQTLPKIPAQT